MPTAELEILPLTPDRWDDVAALFGEGGDPKTCWCMYWRVRGKDWSLGDPRSAFWSRNGVRPSHAGWAQMTACTRSRARSLARTRPT